MRQSQQTLLVFPLNGINVLSSRFAQPEGTCVNAVNVRPFDSEEGRARGGIRPGLSKFCNTQLEGGSRIQNINYSVDSDAIDLNTSFLFRRVVKAAAVCNGTVYQVNSTNAVAASVTGVQELNTDAPVIYSAELFGDLYFTDGKTYKIWDAADNETRDWTPTAGSLPGDPGNTSARLIAMWRSRMVLSGLNSDPHNWFMSRLGDPLDWDYAPDVITETQPVQGGVGYTGKIGDKITSLIPYSDDVLIFGCDHSIWQLSGDPQAGGRIDSVTTEIGVAWGEAWSIDPNGVLYFMSGKGAVYRMEPGSGPQEMSGPSIEPKLSNINMNTNTVRLAWDTELDGLSVFITPLTASSTTHWFWDSRTQGWWADQFANTNYNPVTARSFDGDNPNDRVMLIGSEDGYIRKIDTTVYQDDGEDFTAHVTFGPLSSQGGYHQLLLQDLQAVTDLNGGSIKFEVLSGDTPDEALGTEAATFTGSDGTFAAGFSVASNPRKRGFYHYVKVGTNAAEGKWALEYIREKHTTITSDRGRRTID